MTIELITKNKIADYIKTNPEAYSYFAMWLKESKYRDRPRHLDTSKPDGTETMSCQLGASKYTIQYIINIGHKTACITFFGTRDEEIAFYQKKNEMYMEQHPGVKIISKTITVIVKSPALSKNSSSSYKKTIPAGEVEEFGFPDSVNKNLPIQTKDEYETSLERAIDIFKSSSGTNAFIELGELLPLIKSYESQNITLPQFNMLEGLKLRMQDFNLTPKDMIYNIGTEEDVELFLAGKKIPTKKVLKKVYNMLGLRIPVDRNDFID